MRNGTPLQELARQKEAISQQFNSDYPVIGIKRYEKGLQIVRDNMTERDSPNGAKRKTIKGLSRASLKRLAFLVFTTPITFHSILTLTYGTPPPTNGKIIKIQLDCFLTDMRRRFGHFNFLWWLEFQTKRQAPHFHCLLTLRDITPEKRATMGRLWAKWSFLNCEMREGEYEKVLAVHSYSPPANSKKIPAWEDIRKREGAKWYILKYLSKHEQKDVPPNFRYPGRFWGKSKDVVSGPFVEIDCTEVELREYLSKTGLSVTNQEILPKLVIIPN